MPSDKNKLHVPIDMRFQLSPLPTSTSTWTSDQDTKYLETSLPPDEALAPHRNMPFADINSHKLHYTDIAPPEGQTARLTLIFVHGLGSTQNYYFPIFPYLTSYRCIIFDNYNAGRSQSDGGDTSIPSIGKDVLGLLDYLKVGKAVVIG